MENIYLPHPAIIKEIIQETKDVKTLTLTFEDEGLQKNFAYLPGQFVEFSIGGVGEAPFCLASSPTRAGYIQCTTKKAGKVTQAIHDLEVGDRVGIRGPYGNSFLLEGLKGKNLVLVGGGIGLAPLRSLIQYVLDQKEDYGKIVIIYGAKTTEDLVYKKELEEWGKSPGVELVLTVDPGGEDKEWKGEIGLVPSILEKVNPSPDKRMLITCGPPIMIKFVLFTAAKMGYQPKQIVTTLERKMKCGLGKCGRCNIGSTYICQDGPVFTYKQLEDLGADYLA